jgi:hypothetical protein
MKFRTTISQKVAVYHKLQFNCFDVMAVVAFSDLECRLC